MIEAIGVFILAAFGLTGFAIWLFRNDREIYHSTCSCRATIETSDYSAYALWQHQHRHCSPS